MSDARWRCPVVDADLFDRAEGRAIVDGPGAILKGGLECELDCAGLLLPPTGDFARLLAVRDEPSVAAVLQRHRFTLAGRWTPERRLVEAGRLASRGAAIAVVETREVPRAAAAVARGGDAARRGLVIVAIDEPEAMPHVPVRRHFTDLGIPVIEPGGLDGLRLGIEQAALLADASGGPAAVVVDESVMRSAAVLECRPDRVVTTRDAAAALRRRRLPRPGSDGDFDRLVRRLDLESVVAMPSPGEQETLGIVAVGVAATAVRHLLEEVRLTGRVPAVFLRLVSPVQPASIERLLTRCRTVMVVESRPGLVAPAVLEIADRLRARGERVARIGWRGVPDTEEGDFEPGEPVRPSRLLRRLLPLLREIRPSLEVDERLWRPPSEKVFPPVGIERGPRGGRGLLQSVRRAVVSADRSLRRGGDDLEPRALAINGRPPTGFPGAVIDVEIVERRRLLEEALPVLAARDGRLPQIVIVADDGWADGLEASRILEATIPTSGDLVPRVVNVEARDESTIRSAVLSAARDDRPTVLVARRRERVGREIEEVDRLGYAPQIRVRGRIDDACGVRPVGEFRIDPALPQPEDVSMTHRLERIRGRLGGRWLLRIARMVEIAEIVRERAPLPSVPLSTDSALPPPTPRHRGQGRWRVHLAGVRGQRPGAAASLLARAGQAMGFDVHVLSGPLLDSPAWSQVLFTRPFREPVADAVCPGIPYGEADVVLGIDPLETLRALGSDPDLRVARARHTAILAQSAVGPEEKDPASLMAAEHLPRAAMETCGTPFDRLADLAARVRQQFGNERLLDVVLVGMAYQSGLVPVTFEAMQDAARELEAAGFGRTLEAWRYGRMLAATDLAPRAPRAVDDALARRRREVVLETRVHRGPAAATWLESRIDRAWDALPGLLETTPGRRALDDLLLAFGMLHRRGGRRLVSDYLERLSRVHAADRGDTGRELTRFAVLLLGEAMLPRDAFGLAIAANGLDHRRRLRRRFGVRRARGDRVERTYVARVDLLGLDRHLRVELPVPPRLLGVVERAGRLLPRRWRTDASSRRRREAVENAIDRAVLATGDLHVYRAWVARLREWADIAAGGRLHDLPASRFEIRDPTAANAAPDSDPDRTQAPRLRS